MIESPKATRSVLNMYQSEIQRTKASLEKARQVHDYELVHRLEEKLFNANKMIMSIEHQLTESHSQVTVH